MRKNQNKNSRVRRFTKTAKSNQNNYHEPIPRRVPVELKCRDTTYQYTTNNTGTVGYYFLPSQGLSYNQRVADRIQFNRIDIRLRANLNGGSEDVLRLLIFQTVGLYPVASPPSITDILQFASPQSPYNYNAGKLFHILCDHTFTLSDSGDSKIRALESNCGMSIKQVHFLSGTTEVYSGQLWYLTISNDTVNNIPISFIARVWYSDTD